MEPTYFRRCPSCASKNNPAVLRCACGALLAGIDLSLERSDHQAVEPTPTRLAEASENAVGEPANGTILCSYTDCAQPNPLGKVRCVYCDRPLHKAVAQTTETTNTEATPTTIAAPTFSSEQTKSAGLLNLPEALSKRYRIVELMPVRGAEAELLKVQAPTGGDILVAKIYRHGILPKIDVQKRITQLDHRHHVDVIESGISDGYAYELMELCRFGSLRTLLDQQHTTHGMGNTTVPFKVEDIAAELAAALADVHATGLLHRDLKPENILVRRLQPLNLVLTDFGIASILDVTQRYTGVAHTLPYASPESLSGVIDAKTDYWALGMILLEAASGQHPFAGLSDAVILHSLTTRNIPINGIADARITKLVRGLLLRDPKLRWGADELARWLKNDPTLAEPQQNAANEANQVYSQPYHLGNQRCYQPEQLGVALASHWESGIADITNGQLLAWFRDVQKDQNVVRLLIDQRSDPTRSVDIQLLTLILYLTPGIPAVWQGHSVALAAILQQTKLAIKGEDRAIQWLNQLYQYRVLEIYAKAGNQEAIDIVNRWNKEIDGFVRTWEAKNTLLNNHNNAKKALTDEAVDLDQLMYGNHHFKRPYLASMHAQILAFCYDKNWAEKKRQLIATELTQLVAVCSWMIELGNPQEMTGIELLVIESLLPEARKIVEANQKADARHQQQMQEDCQSMGKSINSVLAQIRVLLNSRWITNALSEDIQRTCDDYFAQLARIRASGRSDTAWLEMRRSALRSERNLHVLTQHLNALARHRAISAGWINAQNLGFIALACFILPLLFGQQITYPLLSISALIIAWRFLPDYFLVRKIQNLAQKL